MEPVGERKIEFPTGFFKKDEKCLEAIGMFFLIPSAIDTKWLLKESEITVGSVTSVFPTLTHIGGGDAEERRDTKDLTPSQTLPIFF